MAVDENDHVTATMMPRRGAPVTRLRIITFVAAVVVLLVAEPAAGAIWLVLDKKRAAPGEAVRGSIGDVGTAKAELSPLYVFLLLEPREGLDPTLIELEGKGAVLHASRVPALRVKNVPASIGEVIESGATPRLFTLGRIRFYANGPERLTFTAPDLSAGTYTTLVYCKECGPSLIPGQPLQIVRKGETEQSRSFPIIPVMIIGGSLVTVIVASLRMIRARSRPELGETNPDDGSDGAARR